jgi:molybdopterin synthase sulfur carrier subunit
MTILYFAWLKERMGTGEETIALPEGVATVGDLIAHLKARDGRLEALLSGDARVLTAVNQQMATPETPVSDGDEVAFFPPMTGG